MKYILILAIMLIGFTGFSQDKWRTLTLKTTTGLNINGEVIITPSINFHYELKNKFAITNWSGLRYSSYGYGWFGSQTQLTKGFKNDWKVGTGVLYGGGVMYGGAPNTMGFNSDNFFYIVSFSKRFKL